MFDHPYLTDPEFSTTVVSWADGGLHFFRRVPEHGIAGPSVFHVAYGLIFLFALWFTRRAWRRGDFRVPDRAVLDSVLVAVAALVIGGRLMEAVIYNPAYYFEKPSRLVLNASGYTIHGMILGVIVAFWFWARWIKRPWFHLLDQTPVIVAFGTPLGRLANFLAGDLWGRETSLPWGVRFPMRGPLFRPVVANARGDTFVVVSPDTGQTAYLQPWAPDQGIEVLKDTPFLHYPVNAPDSGVFELVQQVATTPRHPSQLYQAVTEGLVLLIVMLLVRRKTRLVGVQSGVFLVAYGLLRLGSEFFRQPEPGLGYLAGLTRGQLLCLGMVVAGAAVLVWARRKGQKIEDIPRDPAPATGSGGIPRTGEAGKS
ncbi:MAG: prolipoprotein diacylglyceryl transferase [Planctomycetes bacterium]|nr:prolipoprotein diacylglyceryl transferase [Planctomycetota bacterium]MCL4729352.1 prolipoprotein diacylglyceryl transferase [Planctomycetota bacterium]